MKREIVKTVVLGKKITYRVVPLPEAGDPKVKPQL